MILHLSKRSSYTVLRTTAKLIECKIVRKKIIIISKKAALLLERWVSRWRVWIRFRVLFLAKLARLDWIAKLSRFADVKSVCRRRAQKKK